MVDLESGPGHARQSRRRLPVHGPRALRDLQARRDVACIRAGRGRGANRFESAGIMKMETPPTGDFSDEQKRYLEGFMTGLQVGRVGRNVAGSAGPVGDKAGTEPTGPDAAHLKAQDRVTAAGKKLADQEKFKRELHPFDGYEKLKEQAKTNTPPTPADNFRWRYFGLFYVAPAQNSYMCRLRIPNGIMKHWQMSGLADLTKAFAGGYSHVT